MCGLMLMGIDRDRCGSAPVIPLNVDCQYSVVPFQTLWTSDQ